MKFSLQHSRDIVGNHIDVSVVAEGSEQLIFVITTLDRFALATDPISPPSVQYGRHFRQAGNASPGRHHLLRVDATVQGGTVLRADEHWDDES